MSRRSSIGLATVAVLLAWECAAQQSDRFAMLLSSPLAIAAALRSELWAAPFYRAVAASLLHVGSGVAIGAGLGILAGIVDAESLPGANLVRTADIWLRPVPPLACIPFAIILFGTSHPTATFIVAIGVFWTTLLSTREALRAIPRELHELALAFGYAEGPGKLFRITLPAATPGIFAGVRTAVGQGWTLVVAAELIGIPGIGQRLWEAASLLANETVFAYMVTLALLNRASDGLLDSIDRRLFAWRR